MVDGRSSRVARGLGWIALAGLVLAPCLAAATAGAPGLFDDDLIRVGGFRRSTVGGSLLRPFNEHVAPLFELVGWGAWWASGREVDRVAEAFRASALGATALTTLALGVLVRFELGSTALAILAAGLFAGQAATSEVTLWYSASSFGWSAAAALGAVIAARLAATAPTRRRRAAWLAGAALLALAAPLFSAVGVLAGPLAALRLALARSDDPPTGSGRPIPPPGRLAAAVPLVGTLLFAGILAVSPGRSAVAGSVRARLDPGAAAWAGLQAPTLVLAPALGGFDPLTGRLPDWVAASGTIALVLAVARLARGHRDRANLAMALAWAAGGYALTYAPRARSGDAWIFAVGRYHLFPMVGAILMIAIGLHALPTPRWWGDRRARGVALGLGAVAFAALALGRFATRWEAAALAHRFPQQGASLRAALRLEGACRAEGVSLAQAIRVVPPTLPRWFPRPAGFHPLLYLFGPDGPDARRPDAEAKARVLGRLALAEREALFEGLDARRAGALDGFAALPVGRFSTFATFDHGSDQVPGAGPIHWVDFELPIAGREVQALGLQVAEEAAGRPRVEVWWPGDDGAWSPLRSVVWQGEAGHRWLILGRLPHWSPRSGRAHFRLVRRNRPWFNATRGDGFAPPIMLDVANPGGPVVRD